MQDMHGTRLLPASALMRAVRRAAGPAKDIQATFAPASVRRMFMHLAHLRPRREKSQIMLHCGI
jgi:hypothetical protein